jgi:hypothetical protein
MLLAAQTGLVIGTLSQTIALNAPSAGTVNVTLTDLDWPTKLSGMSFSASTDTTVLDSVSLSQFFTTFQTSFPVTGPGAFYAHLSGEAGSSGIAGLPNFGLYSMQLSFAALGGPVPLPASVWLFLFGLCGTLGVLLLAKSRPAAARLLPAPEH